MTLNQRIQKFRFDLLQTQPFYGDIVMQLEFREDTAVRTAGTDGLRILYNPAFMNSLTDGEINFVLMHEIFHVLLLHCVRDRGKDPQIWNIAADFVVNSMLTRWDMESAMKRSGIPFEIPSNALTAKIGPGDTTENIYETICRDNRESMTEGRLAAKTLDVFRDYTDRWTEVEGELDYDDPWEKWEFETTYIPKGKGQITVPDAGSGEVGGDLMPSAAGPEEADSIEKQVQKIVHRAAANIKTQNPFGNFPVPDEIYALTDSKELNWKSLLKGMLQEAQSEETSWTTPERKVLHMDLILPGHGESEEILEEVWAFADCSGSVSKDETEAFLTQLYRILKEFRCSMNLAYWNTEVTDVYRSIKSEKKLWECIPHSSGGTDINCVYRWIKQNRIKPEVMLVLTDGYFGKLEEENAHLRRKTIVVLSQDSARADDNIRAVGKPAMLQEEKS